MGRAAKTHREKMNNRVFEKTNGCFADITLPDLRVELARRYSDYISGGGMRLAR
jgi:hypothetical protein